MKRSANTGFSLIELLVVISIIAILAAILLPVLGKVKVIGCFSNMKQMALAWIMYAEDHEGRLPPNHEALVAPPHSKWVYGNIHLGLPEVRW